MKKTARYYLTLSLLLCMLLSKKTVLAGSTKLHIATNKENYALSEAVQFQVFLLNPSPNTNNTLFIELLDCHGNKLAEQMLPFYSDVSSGHINLPKTGKAEFYLLYCYVNNANSMECSSVKKVLIKNNVAANHKKTGNKINITYFPEGGTFVAESPNNILIYCTDENSDPIITKGKITDGKNGIYAVFKTNYLGFAKVILNPEDKARYYIEVKDKNNDEGLSPVRIAASIGITLNTTVGQNSIIYSLVSYAAPEQKLPDYRIEVLHNGQTVYNASVSFQNGLSAIKEELKKEDLPIGFITFRLVDKSNKIYAQRVIYNPGTAVAANNFISIIDTVNKKEARVILPGMINGKALVQVKACEPGSAINNDLDFLAVTDSISVNDQLMTTTDEPAVFNDPKNETNRYLLITGTLLNAGQKPVKNKNVNLVIVHKNLKKQYLVAKTDVNGKLQVDNLIFFDTVTVYYQVADKSEDKNNVSLSLKVSTGTAYLGKKKPALDLICKAGGIIADSTTTIKPEEKTLEQVIVTAENEKTNSEKYADKYVSVQMKRSHALRSEIDFIENPEAIDNRSLFVYLQSRIPSLRIWINPQGDPVLSASNGGSVGVYLNDMELPLNESLGFISNLQIKDVAQVKYYSMSFKPKIIGGNPLIDAKALDGGDLLIYTKRDYSSEEKTKGLPKTNMVGYSLERTGDAISTPGNTESLYWKPDWNVASGQRIFLNLLPTDSKKYIEIIIQGINTSLVPFRFTQKLVFN